MYPTSLTYNLHHLQEQFIEFHYLILIFNFKNKQNSHSFISCGNISQLFGPNMRCFRNYYSLISSYLKKGFVP